MSARNRYRMRTPSTGREVIVEADPDRIYTDRETGETPRGGRQAAPPRPRRSRSSPGRSRTFASAHGANSWLSATSTTARPAGVAWVRSAGEDVTRAKRPLALVGATAAAVALAACGGTTVSDDVPANTPAIVPVLTNGTLDTAPASSNSGSNSSPATGTTAGGGLSSVSSSTSSTPATTTPATTTPATTTPATGTGGGTATPPTGSTSASGAPAGSGSGGGVVAPTGST